MQKKSLGLRLVFVGTLQVKAAFANQAWPFKSLFAHTSRSVLLGNLDKENPATFADIKTGFLSINSCRVGYHVKRLRDSALFQPSICMPHRASYTKWSDGFQRLDDKWSKFIFPEPGLNVGFNF